ncbi:uncharacterized protein A4U43_C04F33530 [Asparagus officinalis]|uniref:Protein kinase domain-containing protein n=1 Tax=Asparagus officinalis TaxID=4686 RepID=A0A5P1FAF9_ASPOF|nr:putative serine/threonine-protein kinase [Asparagus officinalis]XP_020263589.1 putative serine/threonine-protein kinase [Asparagus officinalis]XP_020263590.1 putative serine/threonine-protein kinase [Asparagus officinalis]XP_020263591.1 putative serine/threonine-protein kinase [Asparagus officinalis]XP_020263592.1 putative serine/threonine-protein kinase [Asparagus officinalis]ONK73621.1 uncharacterized protein A4U43_C04F33530 [Asparagus officinalis]
MTCCHFCFELKKKRDLSRSRENFSGSSSAKNIKLFSYRELNSSTDNFSPRNQIGRGGFGAVYKGLLKNGTLLAVKKLSAQSSQGVNEFLTEIDIISNVKHSNLVELLGCCLHKSERILVYEYLENGSLDRALLGRTSEREKLNWGTRSAICLGTARGLMFLHEELEPYIVHRDIKASNILLDSNLMPKIGDFGLAKLFPDNITHISTRVAGTTGYLAPEYAMHGQLTKKADIYSFGVLVLEIVSGRSISDIPRSDMEKFLLEWAWQLYEEGRLKEVIDSSLQEYPEEEVLRYTKVALFCTQESAQRRPSMSQVVEMLSKPLKLNEKELMPPGIVRDSSGKDRGGWRAANSSNLRLKGLSFTTSNSSNQFSSAPVSVTELVPR